MLAFRLPNKTTLVLGSGSLAASRAFAALEADSNVVILAKGGLEAACDEIRWRATHDQLTFIDWDSLPSSSASSALDEDIKALDSYLSGRPDIRLVCVTDTLLQTTQAHYQRTHASAKQIYRLCSARNIPVNTTDMPDICDFTFTSTHRFTNTKESGANQTRTPLQIGVTTNGHGCRLSGRVRRDIVSNLPKEIGVAVERVGRLRMLAKAQSDHTATKGTEQVNGESWGGADVLDDEMYEDSGVRTPNRPVLQRNYNRTETETESFKRRIKWVAQVSEYWPISQLAQMSEPDMHEVLSGACASVSPTASQLGAAGPPSQHSLDLLRPSSGRILLVGSGPGHPSLLTLATHTALTKLADLVLADKLVPDAVLKLIPTHVPVRIAKKFPGNAEGAQMEMMDAAVEAARQGLTVVRLKQGDPAVYGRFGEEVLHFRTHGYEPLVVPGVSSAIAGPTLAGVPVTQRGVAESFVVCTGVGRGGKDVGLPGYVRERTVLVLMGVARLAQVVRGLLGGSGVGGESGAGGSESGDKGGAGKRDGLAYPPYTPIAIIERASMPDQRVVESTLRDVGRAMESVAEQRPPGIMVIGWAVLALWGKGDVGVLDEGDGVERDGRDEERVKRWLGDNRWRVREGLDGGWEGF